jgi:type IV secretory pathway VirB10-like protein
MAASRPDAEIAHLYQLPLAEFTTARNALAKQAGSYAAEIRALQKPSVAAWAINQLFWQDRDTYERLIGASGDLRAAHAAVLAGKHGDVRSAGKSHEEAIEAALKATVGILRDVGQPATDATRQAIATTLRALPGTEPAGQLTKTLQPGGFEMLAGLPVQNKSGRPTVVPRPVASPAPAQITPARKADVAAERRAKEAAAEAERQVRLAEHAMRREEFEAARAARDAEKAEKAVDDARDAVKEAEESLAEAERTAQQALKAKEAAEERAHEAERALTVAKDRAKSLRAGT